ncbi:MAG: pyridoxamine 5'-phosphate oxidase family protein [Candidatus Hydrothermarchaeales archaeon]
MDEQMVKRVERFLKGHVYCTLATCSNSTPLSTVVVYVSDGLDLYFFTGVDTKKLRDVKENPSVSVAVAGRRFLFFPQAVEMQGKAEVLSGKEADDARRLYFSRKRPEFRAAKKVAKMSEIRWIRVRPTHIFTYGIGTKPWQLDPKKQFKRIL